MVGRIINTIAGIVELLLALRLILEFLGANPGATFIAWVYRASEGLVAPFQGAFPSISLGGASMIDLSTILAMIVYLLLAWIVLRLISFVFSSVS